MERISAARNGTSAGMEPSHRKSGAIIGGAVGGGLALVLLLAALLVVRRLRRSGSPRTTPASEQSPIRLKRFSYRELRGATGRFSEAHKLGQGGFGCVYKGVLKSGQQIAVKKLESASLQGEREFMNELSIVGNISAGGCSSHVVGLIGFCADSKRKMLVYEFMANRSLQEALFDERRRIQLGWSQRVKIVVDVAQALAFIHGKCEPGIVHGDVKPSNVLLDSDMSAKLADFGLARVKSEVSAAPDLRSEEMPPQRELIERERVRSQRMARDRESRRKKKASAALAAASEDHHVIQVSESDPPVSENEDHGKRQKAAADGEESPRKLENPPLDISAADQEEDLRKSEEPSAATAEAEEILKKCSGDEEKGGEKNMNFSATSGDEQLTDGSGNKSPAMSSPQQKIVDGSTGGAADDDDDWSKMSQSANGTEADTWSKISPSEMDCRSEISLDSSVMGHANPVKSGMGFLSRKKSWGRKKAGSPSPSGGTTSGKDWWWKQEGSHQQGGEFSIKEYIVDWVSCENRRGRSRTREWPWSSDAGAATAGAGGAGEKKKKKARSGSLEWWAECDDDAELARRIKLEQKRKKKLAKQQEKLAMSVTRENSREWWRDQTGGVNSGDIDEFSVEMKQQVKKKRSMSEESFTFYQSGEIGNAGATSVPGNPSNSSNHQPGNLSSNNMELPPGLSSSPTGRRRVRTRSREWWSGEMQRGREWWSGELSGRKMMNSATATNSRLFESWSRDSLSGELKPHRRHHQRHRSRSRSRDWWSGDLLSRATTVSSTPSMRGTVCYVAPEYGGGGGALTDKADVYSFGVLVLVVVSGRRPLQVVASPVSEFERANLISWARHAAQAGRGLDLVDSSLEGAYSKEQAGLFISVALLCLQRLPALRPTMSEIVKILTGEAELPALPFEFSPSPSGCSFKSRRKGESGDQVAVDMPLLGVA